jgi:hypothetical protein
MRDKMLYTQHETVREQVPACQGAIQVDRYGDS